MIPNPECDYTIAHWPLIWILRLTIEDVWETLKKRSFFLQDVGIYSRINPDYSIFEKNLLWIISGFLTHFRPVKDEPYLKQVGSCYAWGTIKQTKNHLMPKLSYFLKFSGLLIFKCRPFKSSTTVMERWKKWDGIVENANGIIFYDVLPRVEEAIKNVGPKVSHFLVNEHKICKKKFSITK